MSKTEERKIIEGIIAGNELIITTFYKRNLPYVKNFMLSHNGRDEDVEDVFQDALVVLYEKLTVGDLEIRSSVHTYFFSVCKNLWKSRLRRKRKVLANNDLLANVDKEEDLFLSNIENNEREHLYRKYFIKLDDSCKELLELVFEGKSMKEISQLTGYTEGYARKKKFECKKKLLEMIENDPMFKELKNPKHR